MSSVLAVVLKLSLLSRHDPFPEPALPCVPQIASLISSLSTTVYFCNMNVCIIII